jgi:hypothetical protein
MNEDARARFLDPVIVRVANDSEGRTLFLVERAFGFFSEKEGREYMVPAGTTTDGPSIPALLIPLIGGTPGFRAAVLHDYLVRTLPLTERSRADDLFYEALLVCGVDPIVAQNMYLAVRAYTAQRMNEERGWSTNNETYGGNA